MSDRNDHNLGKQVRQAVFLVSTIFPALFPVFGPAAVLPLPTVSPQFTGPLRLSAQESIEDQSRGENEKEVRSLEPGKVIRRELEDGQQHTYQIRLSADQFLKAVVEQQGIDVIIQVSGPDGGQVMKFDSEGRLRGQETVPVVVESTGDYRLTVRPAQNGVAAGGYEIRIGELRAATERDRDFHEARKLNDESDKLERAGKYDEALPLAERVRDIRERLLGADHLEVADSLNDLALLYMEKTEYAKAEPLYGRALAIRETELGPNHPDVAVVLNNLANLHARRGEYAKAEPLYRRALAIWETALGPDHSRLASSLYDLSAFHFDRGEYAKAEPLLQRSLAIKAKALGPDHPDVASSLNGLAVLSHYKGEYAKAELLFQQSLAIMEKALGPEHFRLASPLNNLATLYSDWGNYAKAEPLHRRALRIWEKALGPDHPDVAFAINNLAGLYRDQGDYARAEPLYQQSLAIREKALGPGHPDVATTLNNLASLRQDLGDYVSAEPLNKRALAIREKALGPDHPDVALSLNNLANLYREQGDYVKAEPLNKQSLAIWEKALGPDHSHVAHSLNNLAVLYFYREDYVKAEPLYQRALAIWEKALGRDHSDVALALNNLAGLYREQGDYVRAEPLFQRALTIWEKAHGRDHPNIALVLNNLAGLYREQGEYAKAEPLFQRSLAVREKLLGPHHLEVARSLNNLARLYAAKGDPAQAVAFQSRANDISEHNLALNLATGSERRKVAYLVLSTAQTDFTLSLHSRHAPDDLRALDLALTTLLRRKGRGLDAMTDTVATLRRYARPQDRELFDKLAEARSQLAVLALRASTMANPDTYRTQLQPLEEKIESLESDLSARSARFRVEAHPVMLSAVRSALPADGALVEFTVFTPRDLRTGESQPPRYLAYVLPAQGRPKWTDLGEAEPIDRDIEEWRAALRNRRPDVKHLGRRVDEKVMRPVRALLGDTRRLLIAPDGSLNLIPFAALIDEHDNYLVERYTISYLTSGRDLLRLQASESSKNPPLVVANPIFGRVTSIATRGGENTGGPPADDQGETGSRPLSFRPLPRTQDEARAIRKVMPEASVLLQSQATEAAIKQVRSPRILHIATHGFFLSDQAAPLAETWSAFGDDPLRMPDRGMNEWATHIKDPLLRSGLALSGANLAKSGDDDGVLTALEAAGLDLLGTKLVVLSACDTGVGEIKNGEGVQGLRRALVLAGSESQVMSLWDVNDEGTKELMIQYYRALVRGEERSEGLRQVQLRMLKSKRWQHPSHWAAFIQSGEWANLEGRK
jgi:CHAT domain-containing protein/Tfp pilus assembly protein PilF